ncbi:MAG TPA: B12-binding domain-containing radical SAM protein [Candidatus Sulfotelmatobacter sp.]|nr:B12-binding domain-containing radical SAM protein [Candidatus Sulfotelmatobacter sp.]
MQIHASSIPTSNPSGHTGVVEKHPKGIQARVLLSSVFGPYAQDDEFGSRSINPMELYHNQVTRAQGSFSLRMFHRSWGIMMIKENISAPCALLDFPTREDFARELKANQYDIVGITGIIVNLGKVREMCRMVREISPHSVIVVGGHVAAIPGIETMIDADHIVRGEGISWMRRYLGEDESTPVRHPAIVSGMRTRIMGIRLPERKGATAATIIPSVGCPMGCNFCTTSAFFGGKGKFVNFYESGDELFEVMSRMEAELGVHSFFVMDENFLLHRERAMRLLERMKEAHKSWALSVFASANAIRKYTMQELVELGISWLWMGLESPRAGYSKLQGADTRELTRELREHGIRVQGSSIIGLEHHTPDNIVAEIEHAVSHDTDFHQFMLYTPVPGTPLYQQMSQEGRLLRDVDYADVHGQFKFNFKHAAISRDDSKRFLDWAFWRDFQMNGPSLYRISRTLLAGWKRYKNSPDARVRQRFAGEMGRLSGVYSSALWAMERQFRKVDSKVSEEIHALRQEFKQESGIVSRMLPALLGPVLLWTTRREEKRLARGKTYEPPTILERSNWVEA